MEPTGKQVRFAAAASALAAFLAFGVALVQPVSYTDTDPAMLLVAAQALVQDGQAVFDRQAEKPEFSYRLHTDNARVRATPDGWRSISLGGPVLLAPIAYAANRLGFDLAKREDEYAVQEVVSAISCAIVMLLLVAVCRTQVEPLAAVWIAMVGFFGTPLASTLVTGLWTHHVVVIVACLVILLLGREGATPSEGPPWSLAVVFGLIAVAGLCRPAGLLLAALPLSFLAQRWLSRRRLLMGLGVALVVVLSVGLWSPLFESVPRYYNPQRLAPAPSLEGLLGVLVSPSRGLLVLSPMLVWALLLLPRSLRSAPNRRFMVALLVWMAGTLWLVAGQATWWAGHSYGTRHLVDVMPGAVYLLAAAWRAKPPAASGWVIGLALTVLVSVAVHGGSGLFNPATRTWNHQPNIDRYRDLLWSWRYPQALATPESLDKRMRTRFERPLLTYRIGQVADLGGSNAAFLGWHEAEASWRWSAGEHARIDFLLGDVDSMREHRLEFSATTLVNQTLVVSWNRRSLGTIELVAGERNSVNFALRPGDLRARQRNRLSLRLESTARSPGDPRELGLSLFSLRVAETP